MVDSSATAQDVINDQADIDGCQTDHGESKSLQFQIQTQNIGIEFSSVEKVHNEVASVAWKKIKNKYFKINNKNSWKYLSQKFEIFTLNTSRNYLWG